MTALVRRDDLAGLNLEATEARIQDAEARGAQAFRELAALVAHVYHKDLWREGGHDSFAEWCEGHGKKKTWGYQLVEAAEFSATAENERQARQMVTDKKRREKELRGLTPKEAVARSRQAAEDAEREILSLELVELLEAVRGKFERTAQGKRAEPLIARLVALAREVAA